MNTSLKKENVKKILIIARSNIGDIASDAVFIKPLRQHFPDAKIYFRATPRTKDILDCYKGIDQLVMFDKQGQHKGPLGRLRFHSEVKKENFDLVIVLVKTFMHNFLFAPYVWDVRKQCIQHYEQKTKHPLDVYLEFLHSMKIYLRKPEFDFNLEDEETFCNDFLEKKGIGSSEPFIGILPLAAWGLKNWPTQNWNELGKTLKEKRSIQILAFGKTNGDQIGQNVLDHISPEIPSAIDQTTLKQTLALIKRCRIFVGPDSSLLHLASNLNVESIGLYGPTPSNYVYPYFHRQNLIGPKHVSDDYLCYKDQHRCACRDGLEPGKCMKAISVDEVFSACENLL